jgi:hypothetical protein
MVRLEGFQGHGSHGQRIFHVSLASVSFAALLDKDFGLFSASNGEPRREEAVCYGANSIGALIKGTNIFASSRNISKLRTSLNVRRNV